MNAIETVTALEQRLHDAEAEALSTGTALSAAEAAWSAALATGDAKAEAKATTALEQAQQARAAILARPPLLRQALQTARQAALPARFEAAEPAIDTINDAAMGAAERLLKAHDVFIAAAAELSRLEGQHRAIMGDLRQHASEAGAARLNLPEEMEYPCIPSLAMAGRRALEPLRISSRTIYRNGRTPKETAV